MTLQATGLLIAYYVVAGVALWLAVTRDYARTRERISGTPDASRPRLADALLRRVALLVGALAGGGTALLLVLLDPPLVPGAWVAPIAVADAVVTWGLVFVALRVLRGRFGVDVVADLREGPH